MIGYDKYLEDEKDKQLEDIPLCLKFLGMILSTISAICVAFHLIIGRKLNEYVHFMYAPVYASFATFVMQAIMIACKPSMFAFSALDWPYVLLCLLCALLLGTSYSLASAAMNYENPAVLAPFEYIMVVVAFFGDVFWFQNSFGVLELIGCALILGPAFLAVLKQEDNDPIKHQEKEVS